jgi:hypothetical protein
MLTQLTPLGMFRCPACGKRAIHLAQSTVVLPPPNGPGTTSQGRRRKGLRTNDTLRTLGLAIGLGLGLGFLIMSTFAK